MSYMKRTGRFVLPHLSKASFRQTATLRGTVFLGMIVKQFEQRFHSLFVKRVDSLFALLFGEHESALHQRMQIVRDHALLLLQRRREIRNAPWLFAQRFKYGQSRRISQHLEKRVTSLG